MPPERNYEGPGLARGTGVPPGHGPDGPSLETYSYRRMEERPAPVANARGLAHIAVRVADVAAARGKVLAAGGREIGEIVTLQTADVAG